MANKKQKLKHYAIGTAGVLLVLCSAFCAIMANLSKNWISLSADNTTVDLGNRGQGEVVPVKFQLKNTDWTALHMTHVIADCGCTVARLRRPVLNRGQTTELYATVAMERSGGPLGTTITILYHPREGGDASGPYALRLSITGRVVARSAFDSS